MGADSALTQALGGRAPKTRKGRRILESRLPKIVEEAKSAMIIRGNKCSNEAQMLLRDLYRLRQPLATLFMRSHPYHPFEDTTRIEQLCAKQDQSLFAFGSSSKKRPFRLILGRLFNKTLLDMQEYAISDFKSMAAFDVKGQSPTLGSKPLVIFQGTGFESDERLKRAKSLLLDFFSGARPEKLSLGGIEQVVVCTVLDTPAASGTSAGDSPAAKVQVRRYRLAMQKSGSKMPRVEMSEVGPSFAMSLDRTREPEKERWKQAIKVPKAAKPKKEKNVSKDSMGKKRGRIHLGKQDFDQIHTVHHSKKKAKKLKEDLQSLKEASDGKAGKAPADAGDE